jgi:arylsulfatase A-like enzyme
MFRRELLESWKNRAPQVAMGLALGLCWGCGADEARETPRNLLFVVWDTTRADHLGCYGYSRRETSPTLDRLAEQGLLFTRAYSHSTLTPVSAGSFLSGTLPYRHGVRSLFMVGKESLDQDIPSLFELLGTAGRKTAAFVSAKPMGRQYALDRGFELYDDDWSRTRELYGIERFGDAPQRPADATTELALGWLEENGSMPFALMVHLFDAHDSSFVPPESFLAEHLSFSVPPGLGRNPSRFPLRDVEEARELYDTEILFMDTQLARLLAELERLGVRDQTLVVVLADHGESFGEHGYFTHGWLSEEQLRVPIVFQGPGIVAGEKLEDRVRTVDIFPTVAELFDLSVPEGLDGASVLDLLLPGDDPLDREVYAEVHHAPGDPRGREPEMYTLVVGPWKYIHRPATGKHELYQLSEDPGEVENRFEGEPEIAGRLLAQLIARGALGGGAVSLEGLSQETLEELQALGYLGDIQDE